MVQFVQHLSYASQHANTAQNAATAKLEADNLRAVVWRGIAGFTVLFWATAIYLVTT